MIIRGIGYRAFYLKNDLASASTAKKNILVSASISFSQDIELNNHILQNEFLYNKYLVVRAGHTLDLIQPLPKELYIKTLKKDRKLIIFGQNKNLVNKFASNIYAYRKPSVYTGRGIRRKQIKQLRKEGKKDKQKGKSF